MSNEVSYVFCCGIFCLRNYRIGFMRSLILLRVYIVLHMFFVCSGRNCDAMARWGRVGRGRTEMRGWPWNSR